MDDQALVLKEQQVCMAAHNSHGLSLVSAGQRSSCLLLCPYQAFCVKGPNTVMTVHLIREAPACSMCNTGISTSRFMLMCKTSKTTAREKAEWTAQHRTGHSP